MRVVFLVTFSWFRQGGKGDNWKNKFQILRKETENNGALRDKNEKRQVNFIRTIRCNEDERLLYRINYGAVILMRGNMIIKEYEHN